MGVTYGVGKKTGRACKPTAPAMMGLILGSLGILAGRQQRAAVYALFFFFFF